MKKRKNQKRKERMVSGLKSMVALYELLYFKNYLKEVFKSIEDGTFDEKYEVTDEDGNVEDLSCFIEHMNNWMNAEWKAIGFTR